jgi:hypothetical protein
MARAQDLQISTSLAQYMVLVDLEVSGGRIEAGSKHVGRNVSSSSRNSSKGISEKLSIRTQNAAAVVDYQYDSPESSWNIQFNGRQVSIRGQSKGDSDQSEMEFRQGPTGDLELHVGDERVAGRTLWHLMLKRRDLCRAHLTPVLESFHKDWKLGETADQVETSLLIWANSHQADQGERWRDLIDDLGSPRYAVRNRAHRQLVAAGDRVLPLLERLDMKQLDAEQRYRVRSLQAALQPPGADSPASIARRLSADPEVWMAMLSRPALSKRLAGRLQLERLLGHPVEFDPTAEKDVRERQLRALQSSIDK